MKNSIAIACVMAVLAAGCATPDPAATETSGEAMSASCLKNYSPENLATQEYAFDGVVTELREESGGEDSGFGEIDFKVNRWFKGGSEISVTLKAPVPASDGGSARLTFLRLRKVAAIWFRAKRDSLTRAALPGHIPMLMHGYGRTPSRFLYSVNPVIAMSALSIASRSALPEVDPVNKNANRTRRPEAVVA